MPNGQTKVLNLWLRSNLTGYPGAGLSPIFYEMQPPRGKHVRWLSCIRSLSMRHCHLKVPCFPGKILSIFFTLINVLDLEKLWKSPAFHLPWSWILCPHTPSHSSLFLSKKKEIHHPKYCPDRKGRPVPIRARPKPLASHVQITYSTILLRQPWPKRRSRPHF